MKLLTFLNFNVHFLLLMSESYVKYRRRTQLSTVPIVRLCVFINIYHFTVLRKKTKNLNRTLNSCQKIF